VQASQFEKARPYLEKAVSIYSKATLSAAWKPSAMNAFSNYANLLQELGDYTGAAGLYTKTLSLGVPEGPDMANCLANQASNLRRLGQFDKARRRP